MLVFGTYEMTKTKVPPLPPSLPRSSHSCCLATFSSTCLPLSFSLLFLSAVSLLLVSCSLLPLLLSPLPRNRITIATVTSQLLTWAAPIPLRLFPPASSSFPSIPLPFPSFLPSVSLLFLSLRSLLATLTRRSYQPSSSPPLSAISWGACGLRRARSSSSACR